MAQIQPYVLRSWEAEFPDLGLSKTEDGPRVYRRADVERVLRLKHLLFVEGLTLAGARRQMAEEGPAPAVEVEEGTVADSDVAELLDREVRRNLHDVRQGLRWILGVLNGKAAGDTELRLVASTPHRGLARRKVKPAKAAKAVRSSKPASRAKAPRHARAAKKAGGKRRR